MKKNYLLIAAAALFAACASNDTLKEVDVQDVPIGFDGGYLNNSTRAELTNDWFANDDDNSFGVYGYRINGSTHEAIFTNEEVTWKHAQQDWTHPTVRFWDKSKPYNFYAYAPYAANATWDNANEKFTFNNLSLIQQADAAGVTDIAIAIKQGITYSQTISGHQTTSSSAGHHSGDVEFIFSHILSKLTFNVKSTTDPRYARIRVTNVSICFPSLPTSGTASWTQGANNSVSGATTISGPLDPQTAIANDGTVTAANFDIPVFTMESGNSHVGTRWLNLNLDGTANENAIALEEWSWTGNPIAPASDFTPTNKAKEFIVVPAEAAGGDVTGYEFAIKVVYDIQYMKLKSTATAGSTDLADYETDTQELGCVATGKILSTVYTPAQNELWTITIDVNPATIEFCVDKINGFTPEQTSTVEVK